MRKPHAALQTAHKMMLLHFRSTRLQLPGRPDDALSIACAVQPPSLLSGHRQPQPDWQEKSKFSCFAFYLQNFFLMKGVSLEKRCPEMLTPGDVDR